MKNRILLRIAGQKYTLMADESVEYMNEVASFAQQVIVSCGGSASFASTRAIALASVNLADQCIKAKREALAAEEKCRKLEAELEALRSGKKTEKNASAPSMRAATRRAFRTRKWRTPSPTAAHET